MSVPFPDAASLLANIRSSSAAVALPIDHSAIDSFILSVNEQQWNKLSTQHGVRLPLRFDSPRDEVNLLSVLALLNFLSGYRAALHRLTGRGAYQTILSLVLSAYLSDADSPSSILSTSGMKACTVASIASLAQITTHSERDHPTLGSAVKVGTKDAEAFEILELVVGVLHETGDVLEKLGKKDLGSWVVEELERTNANLGQMIHSLASTFPAFRDVHLVDNKPVFLFKKALWLLNTLSIRFSPSSSSDATTTPPPPFPIPRLDEIEQTFPIFADNVLPSLLLSKGIISIPSESESSFDLSNLSNEQATTLRASSIEACRRIVERAKEMATMEKGAEEKKWLERWNEVGLDGYLWSIAKEVEGKDIVRMCERHSVYY